MSLCLGQVMSRLVLLASNSELCSTGSSMTWRKSCFSSLEMDALVSWPLLRNLGAVCDAAVSSLLQEVWESFVDLKGLFQAT